MPEIRLALVSVSDKQGLADLGSLLTACGLTLLATGGTERALREAGQRVVAVEKLTGIAEFLDGRVKTLHPAIHGGILARRDEPAHVKALADFRIAPIDVVVCNLYPFRETIAQAHVSDIEAIEQIDVGGPAMIRAAAKNHRDVVVLVDPADYVPTLQALAAGTLDHAARKQLAHKAFAHVSAYDAAIAAWLAGEAAPTPRPAAKAETSQADLQVTLGSRVQLRYGENPHQRAWRLQELSETLVGPTDFAVLQGKELSYNNLLDADAAWSLLRDLPPGLAGACVVKHGNPCGASAMQTSIAGAVLRAFDADPLSAYGGILAVNRPFDLGAVRAMGDRFVEVVLAPSFEEEALELLAAKANVRLLAMGEPRQLVRQEVRVGHFGVLVQEPDAAPLDIAGADVPTQIKPTPQQWTALQLAWRVAKHVKSNAIVIADEVGTVGIGAGQMSRVDAATIAVGKCRKGYKPIAAASDAFFPFADGVEALVRAGVRAIVQPGGSKRDAEVVAAADEAGIAMVMAGDRHFRH